MASAPPPVASDVDRIAAFASGSLDGNPAGVWLSEADLPSDDALQKCAAEVGLSETAFLTRTDAPNRFGLRWFTPETEVDLCGHATLASAFYLWSERIVSSQSIEFETASGILSARSDGDSIWLDFPALGTESHDLDTSGLSTALGTDVCEVWKTKHDVLAVLPNENDLFALAPNFSQIAELPARGIIATTATPARDYDFASRFFAPRVGIDEDPVTGSAHCALAPFWGKRLGKEELVGYQASDRGGLVHTRVDGERVHLGGQCRKIL